MNYVYLLDTNIISELVKPVPNQLVVKKVIEHQGISALSSIGWGECLYGIKRMPEGKRKQQISDFYFNTVHANFQFIPFDNHAANIYSDIKERLEKAGKISQELDMQIAATAIANNVILVTRNISDFENISSVSSLMIENWFEE